MSQTVRPDAWPSEWMRGVLSLCVLGVVASSPEGAHGYAVASRLQDAGLGTVKGGTLYPILARLESDGLVTSSWSPGAGGPGRKTFTASPTGLDALRERTEQWGIFTERAARLLPTVGSVP